MFPLVFRATKVSLVISLFKKNYSLIYSVSASILLQSREFFSKNCLAVPAISDVQYHLQQTNNKYE